MTLKVFLSYASEIGSEVEAFVHGDWFFRGYHRGVNGDWSRHAEAGQGGGFIYNYTDTPKNGWKANDAVKALVESCDLFVVFMSKHYAGKRACLEELETFLAGAGPERLRAVKVIACDSLGRDWWANFWRRHRDDLARRDPDRAEEKFWFVGDFLDAKGDGLKDIAIPSGADGYRPYPGVDQEIMELCAAWEAEAAARRNSAQRVSEKLARQAQAVASRTPPAPPAPEPTEAFRPGAVLILGHPTDPEDGYEPEDGEVLAGLLRERRVPVQAWPNGWEIDPGLRPPPAGAAPNALVRLTDAADSAALVASPEASMGALAACGLAGARAAIWLPERLRGKRAAANLVARVEQEAPAGAALFARKVSYRVASPEALANEIAALMQATDAGILGAVEAASSNVENPEAVTNSLRRALPELTTRPFDRTHAEAKAALASIISDARLALFLVTDETINLTEDRDSEFSRHRRDYEEFIDEVRGGSTRPYPYPVTAMLITNPALTRDKGFGTGALPYGQSTRSWTTLRYRPDGCDADGGSVVDQQDLRVLLNRIEQWLRRARAAVQEPRAPHAGN